MKIVLTFLCAIVIGASSVFCDNKCSSPSCGQIPDSIRAKRDSNTWMGINPWINEFNSFKEDIPREKALVMSRISRNPGFSPEEQEQNKKDKLLQFQNEKMQQLERNVEKLNQIIEKMFTPSQFKIVMKGCWSGAYAFTIPTGVGAAISANPFLGIVAAITGAVGVVCNIVEANISK